MREIQRYIDTTKIITIPYSGCIDLSKYYVNSVSRVFRAQGYLADGNVADNTSQIDPMYMGMWQMFSGNGALYNINDWTYNYGSWNTALQMRNTISTDLLFRFDKDKNQLYINCAFDSPELITIEYVPRYNSVEEITSDYWIDQLMKLATARVKQVVGRIRTRFTQNNAIWGMDGETILNEANTELTQIREDLKNSTQLVYPVD